MTHAFLMNNAYAEDPRVRTCMRMSVHAIEIGRSLTVLFSVTQPLARITSEGPMRCSRSHGRCLQQSARRCVQRRCHASVRSSICGGPVWSAA
jgi:hypothetical protein